MLIASKLSEGVQRIGCGLALVVHFSPQALQGGSTEFHLSFLPDSLTQFIKILMTPLVTTSPPNFLLNRLNKFLDMGLLIYAGIHGDNTNILFFDATCTVLYRLE